MYKPQNVFWNFYNLLKDLVVSIKIGSSKAVAFGSVLEQISNNKFKVQDDEGNQGVCKLVNKPTKDLNDNEMSLSAFVMQTLSVVYISSIVDKIMTDFNEQKYNWNVHNDSTANVLMIDRITDG